MRCGFAPASAAAAAALSVASPQTIRWPRIVQTSPGRVTGSAGGPSAVRIGEAAAEAAPNRARLHRPKSR